MIDVEAHVVREARVVVEQEATWPAAEAPQVLASLFGVRDGKVARVVRFDDLRSALAAGDLDESTQPVSCHASR